MDLAALLPGGEYFREARVDDRSEHFNNNASPQDFPGKTLSRRIVAKLKLLF